MPHWVITLSMVVVGATIGQLTIMVKNKHDRRKILEEMRRTNK